MVGAIARKIASSGAVRANLARPLRATATARTRGSGKFCTSSGPKPVAPARNITFVSHQQVRWATGRADVGDRHQDISETQFHASADDILGSLSDIADDDELEGVEDVTFQDGVLHIRLETGGVFVINKHFASKQIWYASPVSGALYFSFTGSGWATKERGQEERLETVFEKDFVKACPEAASFDFKSVFGGH